MRSSTRYLLSIAAVLGLAFGATAQQEPTSLFIDRVDVNVVNVEVFVTDKQGRRVADLTADDFEIFEDGQPVEITNFYAVARQDQVTDRFKDDRDLVRRGREGKAPAPQPQALPEDQQLNLVVYVDHFNIRPVNRKRVLRDLEGFLEGRVDQGDNIMLVGYDRKLEVVHPFTRDRSQIADGLKSLSKAAAHGQIQDAERRRILRAMAPVASNPFAVLPDRAAPGDDQASAYQLLRSYVQQLRNELRYSMGALAKTTRSLAGLPGRKALLYVSDGIPQRPGESLYQHFADLYGQVLPASGGGFDPFLESLNEAENHLMNDIVREANAHQVTFYTLDARGHSHGSLSPEFADFSAGSGGRIALDQMRSMNLQEPLIKMAAATGGTSVLNTLNFDVAFQNLATDFDSFYSLGYRSRRGGDGKFHKIKVEMRNKGYKIRHRSGYVDKPEVERVSDRTLSSLVLNLEKNPLGVDVDFGVPEKKSGGTYHLPVMIRIPFKEVALLPSAGIEQGRLRIFVAVQDEKGGIAQPKEISYPLAVPSEQVALARDREIGYVTTLKIRSGVPTIAVGVWDELSGTESFVHKRVLVGNEGKKKRSKHG